MPQRMVFNFPNPLKPKKGGIEYELLIHLAVEVLLIVIFYFLTRPKVTQQTIPYPSLIQKTYENNQITQAIESLRGW